MKRVTVAILSLLVMVGLMIVLQAPNASATLTTLTPGTGDTSITFENSVPAAGYTVLATDTETFTASDFAGTITSKVIL